MTQKLEQAIKEIHESGRDAWINVGECCEILNTSRYKFMKMRKSGIVKDEFVCGLGYGFFKLSEIESLLKSKTK